VSTYGSFGLIILLLSLSMKMRADITGFVPNKGQAPSFIVNSWIIHAPDTLLPIPPDTLIASDTLFTDTSAALADTLPIRFAKSDLEAQVVYRARDSIVYDLTNELILLYGDAQIDYQDITLKAATIEYDWPHSELAARAVEDSLGNIVEGKPVFTQADKTFTARSLRYNFKTKKGKLFELYTEEGEGFIQSPEVKKDEEDNLFAKKAFYTTCELEEPHFYIEASPLKIAPNKVLVTGPANLVIAGVRTPLVLPFALFPLKTGQRSGIIIPEFGQQGEQGFVLKNGGYYLGISDYVDATLRGDIYTTGSWRLNAASNVRKLYRYNGNFNFGYGRLRIGNELEGNLRLQKDFSFGLRFNLDPKMIPNSSLSANVNVATQGYSLYNEFDYDNHLQNQYQSNITYTKRWAGKPYNFSLNFRHSQSTATRMVNLTLPQATFGVSQFYPLRRKVVVGQPKWYEKIGLTYTGEAQNTLTVADSVLFTPGFLDEAVLGARHSIPVSTPIRVMKYFNLTPSFTYTELWYGEHYNRTFDPEPSDSATFLRIDTVRGFSAVRYYNTGVGLNTRLYGRITFKEGKLKAIRHVITPTVSGSYRPDFARPSFGYYEQVQVDTLGTEQLLYRYPSFYGSAPAGVFGGLNFSIDNNVEMKVFSKKDTVTHEKKVKLIESLSASSAYNFAADSLKLSPIQLNARTTLVERIGVTYSATYDPYTRNDKGQRINKSEWDANHRIARMQSASLALHSTFRSKPGTGSPVMTSPNYYPGEPEYYTGLNFPWQLTLSYNLRLQKGLGANLDTVATTQALDANISFSPTPRWRAEVRTAYDFVNNMLGYTVVDVYRDLHCWEMKFRWIPSGTLRSYTFGINVKASVLKDLKIEKKSDPLGAF